jgi:hypothetical protein
MSSVSSIEPVGTSNDAMTKLLMISTAAKMNASSFTKLNTGDFCRTSAVFLETGLDLIVSLVG